MDSKDSLFRSFVLHERDLKAFIGSLVRDPGARDDVFQEVALAIWEQASAYDPARPFGAWARGIAVHKILQRRRQDARFPARFSPDTLQAVLDAYERREAVASR